MVLCERSCARAWIVARKHVLEHGFVPESMCYTMVLCKRACARALLCARACARAWCCAREHVTASTVLLMIAGHLRTYTSRNPKGEAPPSGQTLDTSPCAFGGTNRRCLSFALSLLYSTVQYSTLHYTTLHYSAVCVVATCSRGMHLLLYCMVPVSMDPCIQNVLFVKCRLEYNVSSP